MSVVCCLLFVNVLRCLMLVVVCRSLFVVCCLTLVCWFVVVFVFNCVVC